MDCSQVASEKNRLIATAFCLDNASSCCICMQSMYKKPVIYLPCKHFLHTHCLKETVKSGLYTCPLCRHDHTSAYMKVQFLTEEILKQKEASRSEAQRIADEDFVFTLLLGRDDEVQQIIHLLMQPGNLLSQLHVFLNETRDESDEESYDAFADHDDDDIEPVLEQALMEDWM